MNTKEMIEVMRAFEDGKRIEYSIVGRNDWIRVNCVPVWAWDRVEYRIAPEPKKEGWWERKNIRIFDGEYAIIWEDHDNGDELIHLNRMISTPGFGGIDYQSPFDPKVVVRSMGPLMFKSKEDKHYVTAGDYCDDEIMLFDQTDRPGIPVAAWFWREGEGK